MKRVTVKLFAAFREAAGTGTVECQTSAETASALFEELCARYAGLVPERAALVAINDQMTDWSGAISDGDQVLFFPPVAGG